MIIPLAEFFFFVFYCYALEVTHGGTDVGLLGIFPLPQASHQDENSQVHMFKRDTVRIRIYSAVREFTCARVGRPTQGTALPGGNRGGESEPLHGTCSCGLQRSAQWSSLNR